MTPCQGYRPVGLDPPSTPGRPVGLIPFPGTAGGGPGPRLEAGRNGTRAFTEFSCLLLQPARCCPFSAKMRTRAAAQTDGGPAPARSPAESPLSDRNFSDRPGLAGVANLTDRLLREVRYPLDGSSLLGLQRYSW